MLGNPILFTLEYDPHTIIQAYMTVAHRSIADHHIPHAQTSLGPIRLQFERS